MSVTVVEPPAAPATEVTEEAAAIGAAATGAAPSDESQPAGSEG
jgi:hypothetical protein